MFAVVSIGFSSTSYSTAEGVVSVCVSVQSGDLQNGVLVNYAISVVNTTATGMNMCVGLCVCLCAAAACVYVCVCVCAVTQKGYCVYIHVIM